jgi:anti-anti-sigma factor
MYSARSDQHPDDQEFPGLLLLRPEGRILFVNASNIGHKITPLVERAHPQVVALDMRAVFDLEYTALKMLTEAEKKYRENGISVWLVGLSPEVLAVVENAPLGKTLGHERMFLNLEQALAAWHARRQSQGASDPSQEILH